jgi:hypothetical protein
VNSRAGESATVSHALQSRVRAAVARVRIRGSPYFSSLAAGAHFEIDGSVAKWRTVLVQPLHEAQPHICTT